MVFPLFYTKKLLEKLNLHFFFSFIFHSAWALSKKAADKEKERQKLLSTLARKPGLGVGGTSGAPKAINDRRATNTALGVAAIAFSSSFAPPVPSSTSGNHKLEVSTYTRVSSQKKF